VAQINIRIDDTLKSQVESLFDELGLNISSAVNIFFKEAVRTQSLPLELKLDPFYSKKNMAVLEASIADADAGKLTEHDLIEV